MRVYITAMFLSFGLLSAAIAKDISFNEGTNFGISLSPDGMTIAMDLQGILWTLPVTGGTALPLTSGQQPEVREPSYSPDGSKIAFQGFHRGYFHIWTINADGSNLQQITDGLYDDREPSWNADGKTIVFSSDRGGNYNIWQINVDNGKEIRLTDHPHDDGHPHKSPNGERLLLTREIKGQYSEIILVDYEDDERSEITLMKSEGTSFFRPTWANNNRSFSYISHNDNDIKLNYVADVYSLKAQVKSILIDQGDIFPFRPSWAKDGIYYTADGQIKYRSMSENIRRHRTIVKLGDIEPVSFRASIEAVAPNYTRKSHDFDHKFSQQVMGIGSMDISANDNKILFTALGDMWLQKENELAVNIADEEGHVIDPTWSKDGKHIAYVTERNGHMDIWVREMESGEERQLTNDLNREYRLAWSRDGSKIAYLSTRGISNTWGRADLKVIDVEFGNIHTVDEQLFTPGRPTWSVDGEHIILAIVKPASSRFREGMHALRQYNVESRKSKFLDMPGNIGLSTRDGSGPVISPDGKSMVYISEGEIRVAYVNLKGEITSSAQNRCLDTAQMPRWGRDSNTLYYLSGKSLKSCNFLNGEKGLHGFNLTWQRNVADDKTIHVGKLFDGVGDGYQENVDVFISGGRINKIVPHGQDSVIGTFYDYSRDTMLPGLMAGHSHQTELYGEKLGRNWLAYGITSVRDPGTNPYKSIERKETWWSGKSKGPRMFYAGWLTGGPRVYYGQSYNALHEKALRHELERAEQLDYDMLKSYVRLPDEFQQILVAEGHRMGIPISSHEIAPAIQNGMDSLEHMGSTSRRGYSPKYSSLSESYNDVTSIISKSGLFITPTATLENGYFNYMHEHPEYISDIKYTAFLDKFQRDTLVTSSKSKYIVNKVRNNKAILSTLKTMHDMGGNIAAGTDSPFIPYGIAQHFEIIQFVDAGISNADAIRAATIKVAQNIGVDGDLGTVEVGKLADMVIVDGDPLDDIREIRNVEATIKDGHLYTIYELTKNRGER